MRLLMLLLVFQAGYTAAGAEHEIEDAAPIEIELNPLDYVPLAVGNRWTYEHYYENYLHGAGDPFDIPGYPPGSPPDSLRLVEKIVTIEITHTEVIDGFEYFVFSDADYAWPPLPDFFWGGKKVRLSDEGFLVFRWNGQDIPVYDFGHTGTEYTRTLPSGSGTAEVRFNRSYAPYQLSRVFFDLFSYRGSKRIIFLQEYGVGQTYIEYDLGCHNIPFRNELAPISAVISGEEIAYEQVRLFYYSFKSTGLGQVDQVRVSEGFDFSEGKHSEPSNDFELVWRESFFGFDSFPSGKPACISFLISSWLSAETGVADLGKIDFGLLISKGIPPDLQLDFATRVNLSEGHIYAVRSREGGVALLYVFDAESPGNDKRDFFDSLFQVVRNIKFDWVYYPDGLPAAGTSVQPISWGQLKNSVLRAK